MADPNARLGTHHVADPGSSRLRGGGNLICFSVSKVYFFVGDGPKSIAKLDIDHGRIVPVDPPLKSSYSDELK